MPELPFRAVVEATVVVVVVVVDFSKHIENRKV